MTTTAENTLLSFIARYHCDTGEDVATDALSFILSHSDAVRRALSEFLGDEESGPLSIAQVPTRVTTRSGVVPDLECRDEQGNLVALIESKFWADLTRNQPVAYWGELPDNTPSVLLVVAPEDRTDSLWNQLVNRLNEAGHQLNSIQKTDDISSALSRDSQRRLMLTNWTTLLGRMAEHAWVDRDWRASFEIAEIQGLADSIIARADPRSDAALKRSITDAVRRVERSGWADGAGLGVGQLAGSYYGRYLRLAGNFAWLGIEYKAWRQMRDKPLWLLFFHRDYNELHDDQLRSRLEHFTESLEWRVGTVCIPIHQPTSAGDQERLNAVVSRLEEIGRLIDPDGPTYKKDSSDA